MQVFGPFCTPVLGPLTWASPSSLRALVACAALYLLVCLRYFTLFKQSVKKSANSQSELGLDPSAAEEVGGRAGRRALAWGELASPDPGLSLSDWIGPTELGESGDRTVLGQGQVPR